MTLSEAPAFIERRRIPDAAVSADRLKTRVVLDRAGLEALASRWAALEHRLADVTPFQSLGWARAIFDFETQRDNAEFDPVIAVAEDGQRLVAILPLERVGTAARRVLVPLGNGFVQYADLLLDKGVNAQAALTGLFKAARAAAPADVISLLKVRDGSALALALNGVEAEKGPEAGAPLVGLAAFPDFESYFSTIRTKTRKNMRNARNRLERDGVVQHDVVEDVEAQRALIGRTLSGRAERLREQGLTSRAFRDRSFPDFCASLAGRDDVAIKAFSLRHNDQPIAEQWGFVQGGRYYAFVAARDFSHSDESPGKLHLAEVIRACADAGLSACDLGVPAMPYKMTFATRTVAVRDYVLPMTLRGRLVTWLWDQRLRPALKAMVLGLPAGVRARLMKLAGHGH